ncbi:MAG: prepilin peptidase [Nitratireductor sp.]|nr:prepilin peptidase [Nitratireductor sp.]
MFEIALLLFFPFLMLYAAFSDMVSMTISNKVSLALIAGFVLFAYLGGMSLESFGWHWAMFALTLLAGIGLFAVGQAGGGDVKLIASTALWFGWDFTLPYLLVASILGALLTLFLINARGLIIPDRIAGIGWIARLHRADVGIPYGMALGFAALIVYPNTPWMQHALHLASLTP